MNMKRLITTAFLLIALANVSYGQNNTVQLEQATLPSNCSALTGEERMESTVFIKGNRYPLRFTLSNNRAAITQEISSLLMSASGRKQTFQSQIS